MSHTIESEMNVIATQPNLNTCTLERLIGNLRLYSVVDPIYLLSSFVLNPEFYFNAWVACHIRRSLRTMSMTSWSAVLSNLVSSRIRASEQTCDLIVNLYSH